MYIEINSNYLFIDTSQMIHCTFYLLLQNAHHTRSEPAFSKKCFQIDPFADVFQLLAANSPFFTLFPQIFLDDLFFCSTPFFLHFISPKKFFVPLKIICPPKNFFHHPPLFLPTFFYILSIFVFRYNVNFAARGGPPPSPPLLRH